MKPDEEKSLISTVSDIHKAVCGDPAYGIKGIAAIQGEHTEKHKLNETRWNRLAGVCLGLISIASIIKGISVVSKIDVLGYIAQIFIN